MAHYFFLDENVQGILAGPMRESGMALITTREAGLNRAPDRVIFRYAVENSAVIVTADMDFASVLRFPLGTHSGIVVLRLKRLLPPALVERTLAALKSEIPSGIEGCLAIVDEIKTRTRRP